MSVPGAVCHKGMTRWALMLALALASLVAPDTTPIYAAGQPASRQAKEAELAHLRTRIDSLRHDLQQVKTRHDGLRDALRRSEERVAVLADKLRTLDGQLRRQHERLSGLRQQQANLDDLLDEQRSHLERQVSAAYAMGRQEYMKILLNQEDPATVGRILTYYDFLNRARSERIAALRRTLAEMERVQTAISTETARLQQLRTRQQAELAELSDSRKERARVLVKLESEIQSKDQRLVTMLKDEKELQALIKALVEALSDIPPELGSGKPFGQLRGTLPWPAHGPLQIGFGAPRSVGNLRWQGVVIAASEGSAVKAVSHGRVAFADYLRGYGLLIIIDHGDGYMSLYGHNQSLYKETGDWVNAGDTIATVGDSGGQRQAGLYFEIRRNGRPRDPVRWCRRDRG